MSARETTSWEYECDRCGYAETVQDGSPLDERWERRRGIDLCPGCALDLYRFLANESVQRMRLGELYRHPDAGERRLLAERLQQKGVGW